MATKKRSLTDSQKKFIDSFFESGNIMSAYREHIGRYNQNKALAILDSDLGQSRLESLKQKHKKVINVSVSEVLAKLKAMSGTTVFDILDVETGRVKEDIDRYSGLMVKSIKISRKNTEFGEDYSVQVSLNDRTRVIELLGKTMAMFKEDIDVNVSVSIKDQIKSSDIADDDVMKLLEMSRRNVEPASLPSPEELAQEIEILDSFKTELEIDND